MRKLGIISMHKHQVRTADQALAYMVDCTLATVSSMAMLKSRKKCEFERQKLIAQTGIDWLRFMKIDPGSTRAEDVFKCNYSVEEWSKKYLP